MDTIYFDPNLSDDARRDEVFNGQVFVFSPRPSALTLCDFARGMIEDAFGGIDPRMAQYEMPVERYVEIVAPLKPRFIHHPQTRELIAAVLADLGCDPEKTYMDVPRLRAVTSHGYLTAGVGFAHPPHRDTWYSAPMAQLNYWLPIYDITSDCSMAFHPAYWSQPVRNSSREFNYYAWNADGRKNAAQHIKVDTRKQPTLEQHIELEPQYRVVMPPGGNVLFSGAQLHSTVPNTSGLARYSIDFRAVHIEDLLARRAAPNLDSDCTGTSLRDFRRASDGAAMPDEVIAMYDDGTADANAPLVFEPALEPTH